MSTSQKLNYTLESVNAIQQSLENKGAEITSTTPLGEYASIIDNLPSGGDEVEAIALGLAKTAVENDKVVLNKAISLQKDTELTYTPYTSMEAITQFSYYPIGCMSSRYGKFFSYRYSDSFQPFVYDEESGVFIGESKQSYTEFYPLVWGTPEQLYYINVSEYHRTNTVEWGYFNSSNFSTQKISGGDVLYFQRARFYKNYLAGELFSNSGFFKIQDSGIIRGTRSNYSNNPLGIIPFNNEVYCVTSYNRMYSLNNNEITITGIPSSLGRNPTIVSLDDTGNFFIVGSLGTPTRSGIFKKTINSTETVLDLQEDLELSDKIPASISSSIEFCIQVDPITNNKDFADIFIRYDRGELYYLQWDGINLTNFGKIGDSNVYYFFFNPYDRILITNKSRSTDPVNTVDYHVYSFQNVFNKEFIVQEIASNNFTVDSITGFVKSNKGVDEFGNTILEVSTTLDPTQEPWSDVGKVFGFNVSVEEGGAVS